MTIIIITGIIAIIVGIAILIFSVYGKKGYSEKMKRCTALAEGTLIKFVEKRFTSTDMNNHEVTDIQYHPVYEYILDGKRYEVQGSYGSKIADVNLIGQKRQIKYNPENYAESLVAGEDISFAYNIAKILGAIFLTVGALEIIAYILFKIFM